MAKSRAERQAGTLRTHRAGLSAAGASPDWRSPLACGRLTCHSQPIQATRIEAASAGGGAGGGGGVDAASLRRSCPPRGVPSRSAVLPSSVPAAGCDFRAPPRPAPLAGTRPDGVPSCLCSWRALLPAVLPVPSSPTKGVDPAGAAPPRQDVHV